MRHYAFIYLRISSCFLCLFSLFFQSEIFHEAEVMMKLDHPNIVRIIGTCTTMLLCIVYSFCTYSEVILSDIHDVHVLSMW